MRVPRARRAARKRTVPGLSPWQGRSQIKGRFRVPRTGAASAGRRFGGPARGSNPDNGDAPRWSGQGSPAPVPRRRRERGSRARSRASGRVFPSTRGAFGKSAVRASLIQPIQVAILGRLRDAIMHAGQADGNRANHAAVAELSHQVFVKEVEFGWIHRRGRTRRSTLSPDGRSPGRSAEGWLRSAGYALGRGGGVAR